MVNASIKILQKNIFLRYWPLGCVFHHWTTLKPPVILLKIKLKRFVRKDKRCKRTWLPVAIFSQGNINNFRFWSSSKINICQEWILSSYQKGGSNKRQEIFQMSQKCHSIVNLVSANHIFLSRGRRQTVSPGECVPEGRKLTWVHFKLQKTDRDRPKDTISSAKFFTNIFTSWNT